jgi:hypothetical protein
VKPIGRKADEHANSPKQPRFAQIPALREPGAAQDIFRLEVVGRGKSLRSRDSDCSPDPSDEKPEGEDHSHARNPRLPEEVAEESPDVIAELTEAQQAACGNAPKQVQSQDRKHQDADDALIQAIEFVHFTANLSF